MLAGNTVPILMYHSISAQASQQFRSFAVTPAVFAEQMAALAAQGYTPMTVTQLVQAWQQEPSLVPPKPVVLTFDDGFADFYTQALPVLLHYGFTATLYVTTSFVDGTSRWLHREGEANRLMLSWNQLDEIARCGVKCGAHSHSHPQLDALPLTLAQEEITHSKELLEQHLGLPVTSFAYPFGYQNSLTRNLVQQAGYTSACAVKYALSSPQSDSFALARLKVTTSMCASVFLTTLDSQHMSFNQFYMHSRASLWQDVRQNYSALTHFLMPEKRVRERAYEKHTF